MIVALTGGIGSGKTTVARLFAARGAHIIDTDVIARDVVRPPSPILDSIRAAFGDTVIDSRGRLDRSALGRIVFADETKRKELNTIMHPAILKRVLAQIVRYPPASIILVVVPLLFETDFFVQCDAVIAVTAPLQERLRRIVARDGLSKEAANARLQAQLSDEEYARRATLVIRNALEQKHLEGEVERAWTALHAQGQGSIE